MIKRLVLFVFILVTGLVHGQDPPVDNIQESLKRLNTLIYQIDQFYVDSVDREKLVDDVIRAVLEDLDPHSVYIPADELKRMNEPLVGNFEGVGIQFNILKDTIVVVSPIPGGPSEKLGIQASDKIVEIEGENVAGIGIKNADVIDKLRGKKGTIVNVGIRRRGASGLLHFDITRDKIPIFSVDAGYMANPETGYIKVNRFSANTMEEFTKELEALKAEGMENLILDLQGNGGGYLKTAIQMADQFLSENQMIVYTEGRSFPKNESFATAAGGFEEGKLIILVNEGSASASEIVSGAVQDWDRGLVIGRRSFGKGLVQKPFMLPGGSAVRLTISRYYTPSGRCIQKPYNDGLESYFKERYDRFSSGEMFSMDSLKIPDSLKYFTNNKRVVYGGGGIIPDVFVPVDTMENSTFFSQMVRKGFVHNFALEYVDRNRRKLSKQYADVKNFKENFDCESEAIPQFIKAMDKEDLEFDEEAYHRSERLIKTRLKALIARNLFDNEAFYYIINDLNDAYNKALEVLETGTYEDRFLAKN